jgi:hypothetical protein
VRASLEVADIFRSAGPAYRAAHAGHLSLGQLKVMTAIENCRTATLGGHVEACDDCGHWRIAYNSCRNRHCPKCQGAAARTWLAAREADLLPVGYFHVVFTLPAEIADIAWQNKAVVYDLLFRAAADTMLTIAADPKHLGARIGITAVLAHVGIGADPPPACAHDRTWRRHRARRHAVDIVAPRVPAAGACAGRLVPPAVPHAPAGAVRRRQAGLLQHSGTSRARKAFLRHLSPIRKKRWVVYAKPPFAGPQAVLAYLSRYTHRVAISNRRLIAFDETGVTFRYKDYRRAAAERQQVMTLATDEFIRRFLIHVLPRGFHRIRHYGLLASSTHKDAMALARRLLGVAAPVEQPEPDEPPDHRPPCPCCGGHMTIIEAFARWCQPRAPPSSASLDRGNAP